MTKGKSFWVRIAITSLIYNVPLAVGYVSGVLSIPVAVFLAAAGAVGSLAIWERTSAQGPAWEKDSFDSYA